MSLDAAGGSAPYDAIAKSYQRTKASPVRGAVETPTLDQLLGPVGGQAILDAGCGDGFHARRLRQAGAARVAGVDVSAAMIELARAEERAAPLGIQYAVCAVEDLPDLFCTAGFDVCLASYLLHYARSVVDLQRMADRLAGALASGGRLVALVENPDQAAGDYAGYAAYGFDKSALEPRGEGSRIRYSLVSGREIIHFDTFYYSRATYAAVLGRAGFTAITWHPLSLSPAATAPEYFAAYLANPPVLGLTARRTAGAGIRPGVGP
jgi:toxoflavin synthase